MTHNPTESSQDYPSFYDSVVRSPEWQAWEKVAFKRGFDWDESTECGWLSPKHFAAFLAWVKEN